MRLPTRTGLLVVLAGLAVAVPTVATSGTSAPAAPAANTATFTDAWSRIVYRVGRDLHAASDEQQLRGEVLRQIEIMRESTSGVSMDEEAANLMRFQRAYEANARYFQVVDDALETLMQMVGA